MMRGQSVSMNNVPRLSGIQPVKQVNRAIATSQDFECAPLHASQEFKLDMCT